MFVNQFASLGITDDAPVDEEDTAEQVPTTSGEFDSAKPRS